MTSSFPGQHLAHGGQVYVEARETSAVSHELESQVCRYPDASQQRPIAGARCRERLLITADQSGKSLAGAMECAMHATGRYPDWWKGALRQANDWWCRHYERDDTRYGAANPRRQARPARNGRHSERCHH